MFARPWPLVIAALALAVAADVVLIAHNPAAELAVEMQAGQKSLARVYFDTGSGFNESECVTRPIVGDSAYHRLFFPLPAKPVRAVRLDPLGVTGVVRIRWLSIQKPDSHDQLIQLDASKISPLNDILSIKAEGLIAAITLVDQAGDPQLLLPVTALIIQHSPDEFFSSHNLLMVAFFLLLATLISTVKIWLPKIQRAIGRINVLSDKLCRYSERSEALRLDRLALWFYGLCLVGFVLFSAAKFHGSSISQAGSFYRGWTEVAHRPLLGTPKRVRSDEWSFHTPAILNQLYRRDALAVNDTLLGPGKTAVLGNVPCRHFTQYFRPQFWAFFVLPGDIAFAAYWQCKALLLLTGVFTLLLLLTRSSAIAALCALWFYFSAYTQWGYTWASLLPEMIGLFCWTMALVCYLTVGRNRVLLVLSALICAVSAIDFALCAYPPHQLPLIVFGLAILAGWIWSRGHAIWRPDHSGIRVLCLLGSGLITATVMIWFYFDARETLMAAAGTVYPGRRSSAGGGVTLARFVSHFLDFWKSEENFPPAHGNICETSGYFWLAPVTLLLSRPPLEYRQSSRFLFCCWTVFIFLLCWALLPIPAEVGRWILFDRVPPYRCYHALGLINITIVGLFLAERSIARAHGTQARSDWLRGLVAVVILVCLLVYMNRSLDHFFSISAIVIASLYVSVLILFLIQAKRRAFALCLLVPLIFANTLINPVDRGLEVITESALFKIAHGAHNDWRDGKWLIYAPWADQPGLLAATGIDVVDCLKIVPDKARMAVFDPDQRYADVINRSSYFIARLAGPNEPSSFESPSLGNVLWKVPPLDPRLKQIGVDHVAFASEPPTGEYLRELTPFFESSLPDLQVYHLR
jgi:hypothetical protein